MTLTVTVLLIITIIITLQYIHVRKQLKRQFAEQMLTTKVMSHNDARFRYLLDSLPDYVLRFDSKLKLVFSNKASQHLVENAELQLIDKTPSGLTLSRSLTRTWFNELRGVIQDKNEHIFEFQTKLDGESRYFEVRAVPDSENSTNDLFVICMIRDITLRKQAEAQYLQLAREAERVQIMDKFSEDMAHDLRNPLSSISASTYVLRKSDHPEQKQKHLDNIDNNVGQIAKLLDNTLLMTHLDAHIPFEQKPIEMQLFFKQIALSFKGIAARKSQTLLVDIQELPIIQGDVTYLQTAFENLLYNAVSYTRQGGETVVHAYHKNQTIVLEIQDNGIGMTDEQSKRIFERFYRGDPSRTRDVITGGNGLGLPIARAIIERHGGKILVESTQGTGSRFIVHLPSKRQTSNTHSAKTPTNDFDHYTLGSQYVYSYS